MRRLPLLPASVLLCLLLAVGGANAALATAKTLSVVRLDSAPRVSGSAVVGQTLSTSRGEWSASGGSFSYGWELCDATGAHCAKIGGARKQHYKLTSGDIGRTIRSVVDRTQRKHRAAKAVSAPTALVQAAEI